jgi:agmatinase
VIPLDTGDPSYNVWRTLRDFSEDPERQPGIINVQKYDFGFSFNAIPTFFNMPVALTPEDLKASKVDVAVLGAVTDMGTGMRGAAHGPNAVRNSQVYGGYGARQPHMHTMVDPLTDMVVADFGNAPIDIMSTERSVHAIRSFVRSAAEVEIAPGEHLIPIIVGGWCRAGTSFRSPCAATTRTKRPSSGCAHRGCAITRWPRSKPGGSGR